MRETHVMHVYLGRSDAEVHLRVKGREVKMTAAEARGLASAVMALADELDPPAPPALPPSVETEFVEIE